MNTKNWYTSKTLWVNALAAIALIVQTQTGFILDPEAQAGLLAVINLILRVVTKTPLTLTADGTNQSSANAGFINLRFLVELFLVGCLLLMLAAGCATTNPGGPAATPQQTAAKSLLALKSTIVMAALTTDGLCKADKLAADKCALAKDSYVKAKLFYDAAVDAYLIMSQGGDPAAFAATLQRTQELAATILTISGTGGATPSVPVSGGAN
ncbi:MAG: hypothetical protein PHC49_10635 [Desulfuromonadaceae bacterium]|nr:hypothetical protein [Desulfuromonadaceae bacterium]